MAHRYRTRQEAAMHTNHPITGATAAILLCAALAAVAGSAQAQQAQQAQHTQNAQVNRCVDSAGRITLTDEACPAISNSHSSRAVNDDLSDSGAVGLLVTTGAQAAHLTDDAPAAQPAAIITGLTRSRWADLPRPLVRKSAGTDAATLQTARTTMLMQDQLRRQNRTIATR